MNILEVPVNECVRGSCLFVFILCQWKIVIQIVFASCVKVKDENSRKAGKRIIQMAWMLNLEALFYHQFEITTLKWLCYLDLCLPSTIAKWSATVVWSRNWMRENVCFPAALSAWRRKPIWICLLVFISLPVPFQQQGGSTVFLEVLVVAGLMEHCPRELVKPVLWSISAWENCCL